jgi:hypothetical protein
MLPRIILAGSALNFASAFNRSIHPEVTPATGAEAGTGEPAQPIKLGPE